MKSEKNAPKHLPFYDPLKNYEENFTNGPYGAFADGRAYEQTGEPQRRFLGHKVHIPFGIAAGPLINSKYVIAALRAGFDIAVYKTVRTRSYPCHKWPNVLGVHIEGDLTPEKTKNKLIADAEYSEPLSITNSFGVPSRDPDFWQADLAKAVQAVKLGQVVVGSFQGTSIGTSFNDFVNDHVLAARLVKETGVKVMEMNLSCPNEGISQLLCFDLYATCTIVEAVKNEIGNTPLILKLAYFPVGIMLRELVSEVGGMVQSFAAVNTLPAPVVDKNGKQALPGEGRLVSGVCGAAIKWAGIESVKRLKLYREELNMNYSIIGIGGVMGRQDYADYKQAGADAVMSATGAMWNPYLAQEIKEKTDSVNIKNKYEILDAVDILKSVQAILTDDHFVYTSGKHGSVYINKDALYPHTKEVSTIGEMFARNFVGKNIETVVGPALGGIILSQWTAYYLSELEGREVYGVYTEKTADSDQIFRRGYDAFVRGKNVLVVEDLTTTGGSAKKVAESVKKAGGVVVAVAVMVNRNTEGVTSEYFGAPFLALGTFPAEAFDSAECLLCRKGVPINTTVGHGKKHAKKS